LGWISDPTREICKRLSGPTKSFKGDGTL
jgi:hypothetical protein